MTKEVILINPFEQVKEYKGTSSYWKLQDNINKKLMDTTKCEICGRTEDLTVHHIIPCKNYERLYVNKDNLIVICQRCHNEYHKKYKKINPSTLLKFKGEKKCRNIK